MNDTKQVSGADASAVFNLRSRKNRNRLRRAGFSDREIETLYVHLEKLVIVPRAWREAATNQVGAISSITTEFLTPDSVQAAEAGERA